MKTGFAIAFTLIASTILSSAQADKPVKADVAAEAKKDDAKSPAKAKRNVYEVGVKVAECECCGKANGKGVREALFKLKGVKRVTFQSRTGVAIVRMKDKETKLTKENVTAIFAERKLEHASVKYLKSIDEPARKPRPSLEELNKS